MIRLFIIIISLSLLASCRSTRKIGTALTKKDTATIVVNLPEKKENDTIVAVRKILGEIKKNNIDFKTFTAKVNVDYRGGDGKNQNVNATIRMYKDSAIWISANAILGIEAMRVLITKDSVKLMDKINKVYTERSLSYLQEITQLPLDLYILQNLLIGNPVFLDSTITHYATGNGIISILSIGKWFKNLVTLNEKNKTILHSKLDDAEIFRSRTAELAYSDYEDKKSFLFSTKRRIIVTEKNRLEIRLEFKQYELGTEVSFPYSVPKNYVKQ